MIERMTPRQLIEYAKNFPGFVTIDNVDVVMGDVYGTATVHKNLNSELKIEIKISEYIG